MLFEVLVSEFVFLLELVLEVRGHKNIHLLLDSHYIHQQDKQCRSNLSFQWLQRLQQLACKKAEDLVARGRVVADRRIC